MTGSLRRVWLLGTIALTVGAVAVTVALAPPGDAPPGRALQWLLFVGSSVHVAATGWFFSVPEVRRHAAAHQGRYVWAPIGLVVGTAAVAAVLPERLFVWPLLAFFAWQFFHFQKQNLGMAALAGVAHGVGSVRPRERLAIVAAGGAGIAGLLVRPELLQLAVDPRTGWLFPAAAVAFVLAVVAGVVVLRERPPASRPVQYVAVYLISLLFFGPVFLFDSPYAAVAGLTIAHGYQYLLIVGLVAGAPRPGLGPVVSLAVLVNVALLGGLALNAASHLHGGGTAARAVFGAYTGLLMAHFVVDAGLWRLRDAFPRRFLTERLPYLLPRPDPAGDATASPARSA
ncbi:hypothetical protein ACFO1B_17905 [Dactylosporangium siamense]|uniref:Uncharacterized protein n=1 Tax=Dactylosporangium siamense TaxID=685454 RepID=A0A919PIZ9_9ACTN|nr:hypothetical protein [Dactylosporangium siamense]GIG45720.1 hypothetical protein Dsi01nite_037610 [Dactylosporangium siamense]